VDVDVTSTSGRNHPRRAGPKATALSGIGGLRKPVAPVRAENGKKGVNGSSPLEGFRIIIAPVVLGAGKRLFEGFSNSLDVEHLGVRQSQCATFIDYRVTRP
jgi:hypothetical protein